MGSEGANGKEEGFVMIPAQIVGGPGNGSGISIVFFGQVEYAPVKLVLVGCDPVQGVLGRGICFGDIGVERAVPGIVKNLLKIVIPLIGWVEAGRMVKDFPRPNDFIAVVFKVLRQ